MNEKNNFKKVLEAYVAYAAKDERSPYDIMNETNDLKEFIPAFVQANPGLELELFENDGDEKKLEKLINENENFEIFISTHTGDTQYLRNVVAYRVVNNLIDKRFAQLLVQTDDIQLLWNTLEKTKNNSSLHDLTKKRINTLLKQRIALYGTLSDIDKPLLISEQYDLPSRELILARYYALVEEGYREEEDEHVLVNMLMKIKPELSLFNRVDGRLYNILKEKLSALTTEAKVTFLDVLEGKNTLSEQLMVHELIKNVNEGDFAFQQLNALAENEFDYPRLNEAILKKQEEILKMLTLEEAESSEWFTLFLLREFELYFEELKPLYLKKVEEFLNQLEE